MRETGIYQTLGNTRYFIPHPLPPTNPPLELTPEIVSLHDQATTALSILNATAKKLPDPKRFIKAYVIKEALLSSAIEGIHTTLIEMFSQTLSENKPDKDTQLVVNYTHALETAIHALKYENLPLGTRVILKAHEALMSLGEGDKSAPGQLRKQSVRVGNLVPPPAQELPRLISDLEQYINTPAHAMPLVKAGLAHVQFETIHPFLDGNGRIGRLLIVLMLLEDNLLTLPILYPSYYFKKHHLEYYLMLDRVRTHGDFEGWITYYLKAIRDSAHDAYTRAQEIEGLEAAVKQLIHTDARFSKMRESSLAVLDLLFTQPITSITHLGNASGETYNTVDTILTELGKHGIITKNTINTRHAMYRFEPYLALLDKEYN